MVYIYPKVHGILIKLLLKIAILNTRRTELIDAVS